MKNFKLLKIYPITSILIVLALSNCQSYKIDEWEIDIENIQSYSSPRLTDLNNDGTLDIILGAGNREWFPSDTGVIAIDGKDGSILWFTASNNQIVGSATFIDVNKDNTMDIIIGGRTGELYSIDGSNGEIIWNFYTPINLMSYRNDGWYNFYNSQIIHDIDGDMINDFIICNGGDPYIQDNKTPRPIAKMLIISGGNGNVISSANVVDGKESYCSPVVANLDPNSEEVSIIYGTGGETIGGSLYRTSITELLTGDLSNSIQICTDSTRGFIAPPTIVDINNDGILDIIANASSGRTIAIDGSTNSKIWEYTSETDQMEVYSSPVCGHFFPNSNNLDICTIYTKGVFPNFLESTIYIIDGKNGEKKYELSVGDFTYSSPLVIDSNNDGVDEIIYVRNYMDKNNQALTKLELLNVSENTCIDILSPVNGGNFANTPWIGDVDNDNILDIVAITTAALSSRYPGTSAFGEQPPHTVSITRREIAQIKSTSVKWGAYMGNNYNSISMTQESN